MDGSHFDAWTRRRFGFVASGLATSLLGLATLDGLEAKKKRRRKKKKKKHKKKANVCAGEDNCQAETPRCNHPSSEENCFCFVIEGTGKPFCSHAVTGGIADCSECEEGRTCVDLRGERCSPFTLGCASPCPDPL